MFAPLGFTGVWSSYNWYQYGPVNTSDWETNLNYTNVRRFFIEWCDCDENVLRPCFILPVVVLFIDYHSLIYRMGTRYCGAIEGENSMGLMKSILVESQTPTWKRNSVCSLLKRNVLGKEWGMVFGLMRYLEISIIFASIMATLLFYAWLIPPPLHSAADPFAQAGFVFPDWYVLFSYGYLRWGEYLPQFNVPLGPVGELFGQPVFQRRRCMVGSCPYWHPCHDSCSTSIPWRAEKRPC